MANTTLGGGGVFSSDQIAQINANFANAVQIDGGGSIQALTALLKLLTEAGITAFATGGQTSARALTSAINRVGTVATAADSVRLPSAVVGLQIAVVNRGAAPMYVFGYGTDTIDGIATATGVSQGVKSVVVYTCSVAGNWETNLTEPQRLAIMPITASGAVYTKQTQTYLITKAGVAALTLAAPVATTDDGVIITLVNGTANAHVLTATGLLQCGTAATDVATFAAFAGASLRLMAYQAKWVVLATNAVVFT